MRPAITTITPQLGLDLDSTYDNIKNGSYVDGVDVKIKSDGTSNGYILQNIEGNEYKFTIPSVTAQNRKWLISQGVDGADAYELTLYDAYNNVLATATNTVFATLITDFDTALGLASISFNKVTGSFDSRTQVSYEFTTWPYYSYNLQSTGDNDFQFIYLVQEAIDDAESNADYTAMKRVIGTRPASSQNDYSRGVYVFVTNQAYQRSRQYGFGGSVVSGDTSSSGGILRLETGVWPDGLDPNKYFKILISSPLIAYNGIHIAQTILDTGVLYLDIIDVPFVSQQNITYQYYISNYGEIGYISYDSPGYQKLFGTVQWNFDVLNYIDCRVEPSALGYDQLYWANNLDYYRCFYRQVLATPGLDSYRYDYTTFGLNLVTQYHTLRSGLYDYETILEETMLQVQNTAEVTFVSQSASGGAIKAGDWRYMASFIVSGGNEETPLTSITTPVNVYLNSQSNNFQFVLGNTSDTVTGKVNNLQVTGFTPNVFKYVVLYGIHYAEEAVIVYRIKQQLIESNDTVINISHYGTETYETVAFNELVFANLLYKGSNIALQDNCLIPSNLYIDAETDLTEFTDTITYNIQKEILDEVGEYKNPLNVNRQVGYMVNEGYVFAVQYKLKNGSYTSQVYPITETIIIDGNNAPAGKRVAGGITDVSLTDSGTGKPYIFYPKFFINWTILIDGVPAYDVIETAYFYVAPVQNPRVITCGLVVPTVYTDNPGLLTNLFRYSGDGAASLNTQIFAYPEFVGDVFTSTDPTFPDSPNYASDYNTNTANTQHVAFYAPDYYFTGNQFSFLTGDQLMLDFVSGGGTPTFVNTPAMTNPSAYKPFDNDTSNFSLQDLSDAQYCPTGGTASIGGATYNNLLYESPGGDDEDHQWVCWECMVLQVDRLADLNIANAVIGYYIRPRTDQYGDYTTLKYYYTGVSQASDSDPTNSPTETDVNNGGDTFTQQTQLKQRVKYNDDVASEWGNAGITYYTQNRVNAQMRVQVGTQDIYPINTLEVWLCSVEPEAFDYNAGYSIYGNNFVKLLSAFDSNTATVTDYGSRMIWSDEKPAGSLVDSYRIIPPLNFYDFPIANGDITDIKEVNRQLIALQPLKVSHKFFNSEGLLNDALGSSVVLGDNAVASRREIDMTSFGSRHKQSIVIGRTEAGQDTLYWVCSDYKKIMRFGADGTVCISDRNRIKTWCEQWIVSEFNTITNSVSGRGISAVWNQKDKEYIVTFRYGSNIAADPQFTVLKTISFNEYTNKFTSFYSAYPCIYIPFRDVYLTPNCTNYNWFPADSNVISSDTGEIYLHDDDIVSNLQKPTYYQSPALSSSVSVIINADVINNKTFQNYEIDYEGDTNVLLGAFDNLLFETKTQTGNLGNVITELAMDFLRGQIPLSNESAGEIPMSGVWIKLILSFDYNGIGKLKRLTVKYLPSYRLAQL